VVVIFERRFRTAGLDDGHPLVRASVGFESLGLAHAGEGRVNGGEGDFFFALWAFGLSVSSGESKVRLGQVMLQCVYRERKM
jgi:hypothetical protein